MKNSATPLIKVFRRAFFLIVPIAALILNHSLPIVTAQPTYKLDVKPHLKPLSTVKLEGNRVSRTELADDPGFRLQFHVKQSDGKSITTTDARLSQSIDLPVQAAGAFSIALELFYPAYKGGTSQKGEFKTVSNVLYYKVESGKAILVDPPAMKDPAPKDKK
jgi:hypothetical protein